MRVKSVRGAFETAFGEFSRSFGTWAVGGVFPAIHCRAIFRHPFGMMGAGTIVSPFQGLEFF